MGVVYRARQLSLNRVVAVKMILSGRLASPMEVERFQAEARAAAGLQHPNIVPIHEVGEHDGQHYFSMEFVDGPNLSPMVRESPLSAIRAARYVQIIAEAIQFAHDRGVLHRDLKPSNVLIDPFDQPRITDFGLARRTTGDSELTETGQVLGAPSFVPPEQAAGRKDDVGTHSDVYALGAILYYLLTGRPPFAAETLAATLAQVLNIEPAAPRLLNASIPRDLETLCLKCLEKSPQRRYRAAQDLADELGRFQRGEPILARPVSQPEKLWRWCRRHPVVARLIALVTALLITLAAGSTVATFRITGARNAERQQRMRAELGESTARRMAYGAEMILAQQALQARNTGYASELLERQPPELRGWEWRYLWGQCQDRYSLTLGKHASLVSVLAVSPDGKWLVSGSLDKTAIVWELPARQKESDLHHQTAVWAAAFAPQGDQLATLGEDGLIQLRPVPRGAERVFAITQTNRLALRYPSWALAFSGDGTQLAAASQGTVAVWDVASGLLSDAHQLPDGEGYIPAFAPDLSLLAVSSPQACVLLWDMHARSVRARLQSDPRVHTYAQAFSPDGKLLATASTDNSVKLWRVDTSQLIHTLNYHASWVKGLAFSPDGSVLASAGFDQQVVLWDVSAGTISDVLKGHLNEVHSVAFSADGKTLATGSKDQTVKLWDLTQKHDRLHSAELPGGLLKYGLAPDGSALFLWELNGRYSVRSLFPPDSAPLLTATNSSVTGGVVDSRGARLALALQDGSVQLYANRSASFELAQQWNAHAGRIQQLAFSHDGRLLATAGADTNVRVWSLNPLEQVAATNWPGSEVLSISFSRDSQTLGWGCVERTGAVWSWKKPGLLSLLTGHLYSVSHVAFGPGNHVATVSDDGTAKLWDLSRPGQLRGLSTLRGPLTGLQVAVFSPDGKRLAAGGGVGEGELFLWDTETGLQVARLTGHRQRVMALAFADDDTLVSVSPDAVHIWRATPLGAAEQGP